MSADPTPACFLAEVARTPDVRALFDEDLAESGFVMNVSRLWAYAPGMRTELFELLGTAARLGELTFRERGVLVTATASTIGDSYCSIAWGGRLASSSTERTAIGVIGGDNQGLTEREHALARWARAVASDPSGTEQSDVDVLRSAGFTDQQIFGITAFVALRVAFSTINASLGATPDGELHTTVPAALIEAVTYGRRPAAGT